MNLLSDFTVTQPTRLRFGCGAVDDLAAMVRECNGSKVMLVMDPGLKGAGLAEKICAPLEAASIPYTVYDQIDRSLGKLTGKVELR